MPVRPVSIHPVDGFKEKGVKKSLSRIPHFFIPGLNTCLMSSISSCDEAIEYYSKPDFFSLPVPLIKFSKIEPTINVVLDSVNLKLRWKIDNENLLRKCRETISSSTLNSIKTELHTDTTTCLSVPFILARYTSKLMENPDEYFDSDYNWYFKNTIEKFQMNGKWYLACARGINLDYLDVISIENNKYKTIKTIEDKCFKGPIFDIKSTNLNELMIRQKNKLFLFTSNSDTETLMTNNSIYDDCDVPLTDADITSNTFCTADVKHVIKLWKDRKCIQQKYFEVHYNQTDSYMNLNYFQNQTDLIAIINRQKCYTIDTRVDISKPCSTYDPNTIIEPCEELTALKNSQLNMHSIYVASNHSVLMLDNRMGFVNKSYHMLSNPPSLINTHCYENSLEPNEMLLLGNQTGESLVNLSYTSTEDDFLVCQNIASSIPKPLDTLYNVRLQGHCLNPLLFDRFTRCLIGTTAFGKCIEDLRLFSINSAGDLFVQKMYDYTPVDVVKFNDTVSIKSQTVPKLNYSLMFDMSKLLQLEPQDSQEKTLKKNQLLSISKKKITSYVDHLAPLILAPWDVDDLSDWESEDDVIDGVNDASDCDYNTKIRFWFNKNDSLMRSDEFPDPSCSNLPNNLPSQASTSKAPPSSEIDEDSSSGFSVSLNSDDS